MNEFKVGDWVVVLNNKKGGNHIIGKAYEITDTGHIPDFQLTGVDINGVDRDWYYSKECIRKAKPHEISGRPIISKEQKEHLLNLISSI